MTTKSTLSRCALALAGAGLIFFAMPSRDDAAPGKSLAHASPSKETRQVSFVPGVPTILIEPERSEDLLQVFEAHGYDLEGVREQQRAVPRLYVSELPSDLPKLQVTEERKAVFLQSLLPLVLLRNEEIRSRRARLELLQDKARVGAAWSTEERGWLDAMADLYDAPSHQPADLLLHVDEIPVSLALAQAVLESGWGTSRFAQQGNALFGQRIWKSDGKGMVPHANRSVRVQAFNDLMASVRAYTLNLNSHAAYAEFRALRADLRKSGKALDGELLAQTLSDYAELDTYEEKLEIVMAHNDLHKLEAARLTNGLEARLPQF